MYADDTSVMNVGQDINTQPICNFNQYWSGGEIFRDE
jgi:hypothetical protein